MIYRNGYDIVGNTPILELRRIEQKYNLKSKLYAKLEMFNPAGSVKDRIALNMINDAENKGILTPGATIIEPTSGNTGIGLASIGAMKGYKVILTMPESMSIERRKMLKIYGAEIVLTPASEGMKGAINKANELNEQIKGSVILGQFVNPANPDIHYQTTGKEIYKDMEGHVDIFVAGVGTGGTISGIGKYLKEQNKNIKVVAVEPLTSPVLSKGVSGKHGIQGIGAGFIPQTLNTDIYDEIDPIADIDAINMAKEMASLEGLSVGISSGAALKAGLNQALRKENEGKNIIILLPDSGDRYLSTALFE